MCASTVTVGGGTVHTAHGLLPVPAPATARLLTGVPVTAGDIAAELCTPTGAALLRTFARSFGPMPGGAMLGCGYGHLHAVGRRLRLGDKAVGPPGILPHRLGQGECVDHVFGP